MSGYRLADLKVGGITHGISKALQSSIHVGFVIANMRSMEDKEGSRVYCGEDAAQKKSAMR